MVVAAGEQLREARELKGLTVEDVAARLKVPARYIRALEEGDVASLPEPTFVRGYARAYARALGVDADALLEQLAPVELKAPKPLVAVDGGTTVRKASAVRTPNFRAGASRRRFGVMITVAVALVVVVFAFVALRERHQQAPVETAVAAPAAARPLSASPSPSAVPLPPPVAAATPVPVAAAPAGQAVTLEIRLPLPPAPAGTAANPAGAVSPPTAGGQPVALPPAGSTAMTAGGAAPVPAATGKAPAAAVPANGSAPVPATPDANIPAHGLYIRFRGSSWVEVRDAGNRVLHTGTPAGGTDLSLDGKAPLTVTFSDSSVADVWYNGVRQQDRSSGHARVNRIIVGQPVR